MATFNISGGQINIAGGNGHVNAVQVNSGNVPAPDNSQVNMISGDGQVDAIQVNVDGDRRNYSRT